MIRITDKDHFLRINPPESRDLFQEYIAGEWQTYAVKISPGVSVSHSKWRSLISEQGFDKYVQKNISETFGLTYIKVTYFSLLDISLGGNVAEIEAVLREVERLFVQFASQWAICPVCNNYFKTGEGCADPDVSHCTIMPDRNV